MLIDSFGKNPDARRSRQTRCVIIGAGVSGILMAYKLKTYLQDNVEFCILEKNSDLGGTWFENRYPGCACDVPSHVYQYSFAPNSQWSKFYADSPEIQQYLKDVCHHYGLARYITYNSEVTDARWNEEDGTWSVKVGRVSTRVFYCEILVNAGGILNNYKMPAVPGLSDFDGPILHTANWDDSVDLRDKRVAIIGAGASAVQVLPAIQPTCQSVDIYIRTPSWICPPVGLPPGTLDNPVYTKDEMRRLREDSSHSLSMRKDMEDGFNSMFSAFRKGTPEQENMRQTYDAYMRELIKSPDLQAQLIPSFEVGCRRINPSAPYLVALQRPNVHPRFGNIVKIQREGIVAAGADRVEGKEELRAVDIIIAATGFDTSFRPRFPIIGRKGTNLQSLWESRPVSYMGTGVAGFPNYLTFLGPNTPISNGGLMGVLEATSDYFIRLISKFCREDVKAFDVTQEAQNDFSIHTQNYMKEMVWSGACRSWFKSEVDGHITALWPGSSLHYIQTLAEDRFSDYSWTYRRNRFDYWQNGFSWIEQPESDPLGLAIVKARCEMATLPREGADWSFWLTEAEALPMSKNDSGEVEEPDRRKEIVYAVV
ncbi:hypothetical protein PFICI_03642 [Pestalotiopsis fici W106-1]|uniref:Sterigmatocystin biosynthesis monooxygenase stcW n=1 Tax=Pestalotiopsis fici (strain W106-1 / CGMCC3.15140) TaxID=1229662 RepID=W3XJI4_PESFW|nr:uncharacterized protein PFICI_03642 [Pestalotiopsis fici W106-1]ETS85617.1 hypothetical protein PFICI_03642 [Pestalotiopsis fici W106-1]